jgi:hypothetical protein
MAHTTCPPCSRQVHVHWALYSSKAVERHLCQRLNRRATVCMCACQARRGHTHACLVSPGVCRLQVKAGATAPLLAALNQAPAAVSPAEVAKA